MQINDRPIQTVTNLLNAFPIHPPLMASRGERNIPIGVEVEVSWRSYFPDLWVEGFPNVDPGTLARITAECKNREAVLIPRLVQTTTCGIPTGADKYWEFAFDPVTDVSIVCNQIAILKANGLIPPGRHALHITVGGMKPTADAYYMAMVLEAFACDSERVRTGFDQYGLINLSKGWARKGRAALFHKQGAPDLQHGYEDGTEFRLMYLPATDAATLWLLNTAQKLSEIVLCEQGRRGKFWTNLVADLRSTLNLYGLPDTNWGRVHENPQLWNRVAMCYNDMAEDIRCAYGYRCKVDGL